MSTYEGTLQDALSWVEGAKASDAELSPEQHRWQHAVREAQAIKRELAELSARYRLANESDYEWAVPCMLGLESVCDTILDGIAAAVAHDLGPEQRASRT